MTPKNLVRAALNDWGVMPENQSMIVDKVALALRVPIPFQWNVATAALMCEKIKVWQAKWPDVNDAMATQFSE